MANEQQKPQRQQQKNNPQQGGQMKSGQQHKVARASPGSSRVGMTSLAGAANRAEWTGTAKEAREEQRTPLPSRAAFRLQRH
jgi:hypothetical protein